MIGRNRSTRAGDLLSLVDEVGLQVGPEVGDGQFGDERSEPGGEARSAELAQPKRRCRSVVTLQPVEDEGQQLHLELAQIGLAPGRIT